jgi:hypothetical protein
MDDPVCQYSRFAGSRSSYHKGRTISMDNCHTLSLIQVVKIIIVHQFLFLQQNRKGGANLVNPNPATGCMENKITEFINIVSNPGEILHPQCDS